MMKKKINKRMLIYTYVLMFMVAITLTLTSDNVDRNAVMINVLMFLIVGMVFLFAYKKLSLAENMGRKLGKAAKKIEADFDVSKNYLWYMYKIDVDHNLFEEKSVFHKEYGSFVKEMNRLEDNTGFDYTCDIENYINKDFIDNNISKNRLNMISGAMTGLGILGTFVGLTFALQNFSIGGGTEEIVNTIPSLMNGIKIAFHTSIYGMVFSLVFNMIYRTILEDAYSALNKFLTAYRTKVVPDSMNDNEYKLLEIQKKQLDVLKRIADSMEELKQSYRKVN